MFNNLHIKSLTVAALILGIAGAAMAQDASIIDAMKSKESGGLNPGHSGHDKDNDGRDEHMDDKNGNGYGHTGKDKDKGNKPPECVPEPATMLALGAGAGVMALRRRRAAKKAS